MRAKIPFVTVIEALSTTPPAPQSVWISESRWRDLSFVIDGVNGTLQHICDSLYSLSPLPLSPTRLDASPSTCRQRTRRHDDNGRA